MLRPRIIPCLLVKEKGLVKTTQFSNPKYIGDPINAVKIFNEKGADELIIVDIDATVKGHEPDYRMIENVAAEARMPLCYGGGIKTVEHAKTIIKLGVEKIAISSAAFNNLNLISEIAEAVGTQSVVVVLDVKMKDVGKYEVWTHNATFNTGLSPVDVATELEKVGVGEIVLNSIDRDGMMAGYDFSLIERIVGAVTVPVTVLGGAGQFDDFQKLINRFGIVGAAAGSIFVFKGVYKAVLISYPNQSERNQLFQKCAS